ncbi:MAG: nucleotidyl transferase AbiEii/AbiGii toxin family protein [Candidatus Cloacimonadota bacterium]|nr:nucleotidyl transferase AbiEii/AbiGii toxin family protein [Candidatus Cloacimonadota bacterium]
MHSAIELMLQKYNPKNINDHKNALKEIIQEIALLGLFRSGFYNNAAFYGGTALRIFYGLDRFSEDLDFSLLSPKSDFSLSRYTKYIQNELGAYGFEMTVDEKTKSVDSTIKSAFIKGGTEIHLLKINSIKNLIKGIHANEQFKIKLEVDTNPPAGAVYEVKYQLNPIPYSVRLFSAPSLFAGKIHALLFRKWGNRVKGRDFYDYIWYLSNNIKVDLNHLSNRMKQTEHLKDDETLTINKLINMLLNKFAEIDFQQAKRDVLPFIKNTQTLDLWSEDFFKKVTEDKLIGVNNA